MTEDRKKTWRTNPRRTFKENKPNFSIRAHSTMRIHDNRIEIGFRIPHNMEKHLFLFLWETKPHLRKLVLNTKSKA